MIHAFRGVSPKIHPRAFVVKSAEIIGDVAIGEDSSVWYNAVIRGDINSIQIGMRTNIQDGCLLHVRHEYPLVVGSNVTAGHGAIIHACRIDDNALIGMGAIVLDNAHVKPYTIVAAGAVVRNDDQFDEGVLVAGVPAKVVRRLTDVERKMIDDSAQHYVEYAKIYQS